ncbi:hypothetical protein SMD22_00970 (plasmid) [Brevibacillus halotolerans]|nr:hypothetical protein SMD22_00970 [Brevibacillus halotolerans]
MPIFYHVSTLITHDGEFTPRIPSSRLATIENDTMERICVSPAIEDCFTALPGSGDKLHDSNFEKRGYYKIFRIDTEKLGIDKEFIITCDQLYKNNWVPDAFVTKEHWITKSFAVPKEDSMVIKLDSWNTRRELAVPYHVCQLAQEKYEGDVKRAYRDLYQESIPFVSKIVNVLYQKGNVYKGDILSFIVQSEQEEKVLSTLIEKRFNIGSVMESKKGEILVHIEKQSNLLMLFCAHLLFVHKNELTDDEMDEFFGEEYVA